MRSILPYSDSRATPISPSQFEWRLVFTGPTQEEVWISRCNSRIPPQLLNFSTWCEELTHWKRPWCWERLKVRAEGDDRGWDGWMSSLTQWTWVWVDSRSWWWTGRPGVLQSMGSQRVRAQSWLSDWTELNWMHEKHLLRSASLVAVSFIISELVLWILYERL